VAGDKDYIGNVSAEIAYTNRSRFFGVLSGLDLFYCSARPLYR